MIVAFDVQPDGTLARERVFFDAAPLMQSGRKGLPDGLKVDCAGNVFSTGPGGVLVLSPTGRHLGSILTGQATANCAWGDDGSSLYVTADMYLCRVKTRTRGASFRSGIAGARWTPGNAQRSTFNVRLSSWSFARWLLN